MGNLLKTLGIFTYIVGGIMGILILFSKNRYNEGLNVYVAISLMYFSLVQGTLMIVISKTFSNTDKIMDKVDEFSKAFKEFEWRSK
ncbi:MAG: hypothetical protein KDC73_00810 [Ignavibacteriae bacterium]|nr:hypothetical protein [Ignavibacteriota bacterium]MCB9243060.1 hypothetical protein [Ignavibacteriales bacterium]